MYLQVMYRYDGMEGLDQPTVVVNKYLNHLPLPLV
jgi:hypothetical protein